MVNSKFNPIIGLNSALRLGLIVFQTAIYQGWSNSMPIDSVDKNPTNATCIAGVLSGNDLLQSNEKCNSLQMPETITKIRSSTTLNTNIYFRELVTSNVNLYPLRCRVMLNQ